VIEEKTPETSHRQIATMLLLSVAMASLFYCSLVLSCSMAMARKDLLELEFPAAGAFAASSNSDLWAKIVLISGLLGVFATWNSFLIASSRTFFALGRARLIHASFARIHPVFGCPVKSIIFVGALSGAGVFLGRGGITPIVNMVSGCIVLVYFIVALAIIQLRRTQPDRPRPYRIPGGLVVPVLAALASLCMLVESFYLPYANRNGKIPLEWILFAGWTFLGVLFWCLAGKVRAEVSESRRRALILGEEHRPQANL
jgi:APA family basic amino acid/polyamine antiporter